MNHDRDDTILLKCRQKVQIEYYNHHAYQLLVLNMGNIDRMQLYKKGDPL